jgi:TolB-like protein/tetratricopeptide (TPR) repeat protein
MGSADLPSLWGRLKDDVVFRVGTLYAGASWFLVEALDTLQLPAPVIRGTALVLAALFLPVLGAAALWRRRRAAAVSAGNTATASAPAASASPADTRSRSGAVRWATATVAFVVIALGLWAFGARVTGGTVPAAAERIAVLPFHATGSDEVREFGVGMVDLLSAALSDVGPIRTVASRSVLARVGGGPAPLSVEAALVVGRELGAGSVLTGSITAFGGDARLIGELRDVRSGAVMATADVRGSLSGIMALTDQLAVALLRELWRARTPLPTIDVASLTTDVPAALRAWFAGEQHLRALRLDSASHYFTVAVEADSTFSLGWARLGEALGWEGGERRQYLERALAEGGRLPQRERSLLNAVYLHLTGSFAAFDSLHAYVRRHPDDPMGWYQLGDARFHTAYLGRFNEEDIVQPFLQATRLDPTFGSAMIHVLDIGLTRDDRALFDSVMPLFRRFGDGRQVERYDRRARLRWAAPDSILHVFAAELRVLDPERQRRFINDLISLLGARVRLEARIDPRVYLAGMDSLAAIHGSDASLRRRAADLEALGLLAMGRSAEGLPLVERLASAGMPPNLPDRQIELAATRVHHAQLAYTPMAAVAADFALLETLPDTAIFKNFVVFWYLHRGEHERARRLFSVMLEQLELRPLDEFPRPVDLPTMVRMMKGYFEILTGDLQGLAELEGGLRQLGYMDAEMTDFPWEEYGTILLRVPGREREGVRVVRDYIRRRAHGTGPLYLQMADALERIGDRDAARDAYAHAARFLANADELQQPQLRLARAGLERMAREPGR